MKLNKESFFNFYSKLRFLIPGYITWASLYVLAFLTVSSGNNETVVTFALIVIGICVALAQTCFTYYGCLQSLDEINMIVVKNVGEHFFLASVWMSISLLVLFLQKFINSRIHLGVFDIVFYAVALLHFTESADSINKGINRLSYLLFWKIDVNKKELEKTVANALAKNKKL